jgi:hypothetical protein
MCQLRAQEYADLFRQYLRTPQSQRIAILNSMAQVISKVRNKPAFSCELKAELRRVEEETLVKPLIRHQWHEFKHAHPHHKALA